ncbi:MAG: PAS domain S-box protein, partial [Desulfatiglandales bacterium]
MFLAFIGTTTLLLVSFYYQKKNIEKQEIEKANDFYRIFCSKLKERQYTALALASLISHDPKIPRLVGERQKATLYEYAFPIYQVLRSGHGIYQLHFHSLGAWSLLRMNAPEIEGERIAYRKSIMEVQRLGIPKGGVEWGLTGLSVRGVVPLWSDSEIVGSLEVGFPLDESFLLGLKEVWKVDFAIFEVIGPNYFHPISSTSEFPLPKVPIREEDLPFVRVSPPESPESLLLLGPLKGESDELVALVGIKVNRHKTIEELQRARKRTLLVASLGIILSCLVTYLVAVAFVKPIKEVVQEAHEIAAGERESLLKERPFDEMGILTNALNRLLSILLIRKNELERYAKILEKRVLDRTEDLIKSEEKYRTLVENLPIIVYRILKDGTVEFVNSYFTEKIGYTIEEIVKDKEFWWKNICNLDTKSHEEILKCCWDDGKELRKERKIKTKDGKELIFVDHIIPVKSNGNVKWIDGFMVDITELKMLEEKIIEAEELRALRDISQRFAHEIRNPITAAGGFARRLYLSLPADSPYKRFAEIILTEISRLEAILNILLATIEPIKLNEELVELLALLDACVEELDKEACIQNKKIAFHKRVETLWLNGDRA